MILLKVEFNTKMFKWMFQIRLRFFTLFYHFESILGGIKTRLKCFNYTNYCLIILGITYLFDW